MAYIDKAGNIRSSSNPSDVVRLAFPSVPRAASYYNNSEYTPKDPNDYITNALGFLPINTKYLSNTTNGFAMNSFADALFNQEASRRLWEGTVLDHDTTLGSILNATGVTSTIINPLAVTWNTVAKPIFGSVKMALENPNDNFNLWDGLSSGLSTAAMNSLVNIGNTLDIIANPVKGAILEGIYGDGAFKGFQRGLIGDSEYGRKQYDYSDYGYNFGASLVLEIISDPINWITLGGKSLISGAAKAGTSVIDDVFNVATDVLSKGVTKEVIEEAVPQFGEQLVKEAVDGVGEKFGKEVTKNVFDNAIVQKSITKYTLNNGDDAVEALTKAFNNKGFKNITEDNVKGLLKHVTESGKPVSEAVEEFATSAKSSAVSTLKRLAKNPDLAEELVSATSKQSKLAKFIGAPEIHKLPDNLGEAVYKQLSQNKNLRGVAAKWAGYKGWTPATQNFAASVMRDVTLDNLPSLARASKLYYGADYVDAFLRNIALRGTGVQALGKGGAKLIKKGVGVISNHKMNKFIGKITNTTEWLLQSNPDYAVDFSKHGDVVYVKSVVKDGVASTAEAPIKEIKLPFKAVDDVLNKQRDNILKLSFLKENLDVTGLQKMYDDGLADINKTIGSSKRCKQAGITNLEELVTYLNKLKTDDEVINKFIKKLNDTHKRLSKKVTQSDLNAHLETLKGIADLADREGVHSVTENLEIQNIISSSAISKTITEARFEEAKRLRAAAKEENDKLRKSLKLEEKHQLLSAAESIARGKPGEGIDSIDQILNEINQLLEVTYKPYAGNVVNDLDAVDELVTGFKEYRKNYNKALIRYTATPNKETKQAVLTAASNLISVYESLKKELLSLPLDKARMFTQSFDQVAFKDTISMMPEYSRNITRLSDADFKDLLKNATNIDRRYASDLLNATQQVKAARVTYAQGFQQIPALKDAYDYYIKALNDYEDVQSLLAAKGIEYGEDITDASLDVALIKTASELTEAYERLRGFLEGLDYTSDAFKQTYPTRPHLEDFDGDVVEWQKAYIKYEEVTTAVASRLATLKSKVISLPDLSKPLTGVWERVNSVDIDSVVTNQLVGYALGLSKHGLLTRVFKGEGTEHALFTRLLDDFDSKDSVLKRFFETNNNGTKTIQYTPYSEVPDRIMKEARDIAAQTHTHLDEVLKERYNITLSKTEYELHDNIISQTYALFERLSETRKLMRNVESVLSKRLDSQHVACFMDEFISKALEKPNALSPENIVKTLEEVFEGTEQKLSAYMDVPKLTQDYLIRDLLAELAQKGTGFDIEAFARLRKGIDEAHDSLADINNWTDAFVKLNSDNQKTLYELTEKGKRYIVVLDTETTGLAHLPGAQVYQLSAKIIDYSGNEIAKPIKLNIKVNDMPDTPVLNKLFKSVSEKELDVLRKALNKQDITAEDWFKHTYMNDGVLAEQNAITMKQALNTLYAYMWEAQSKEGLLPVLAGHNITGFDLHILSKKASFSNTALKKYFDEAALNKLIFDTYADLQTKQFWRIDTELIDSYIPQLVNIIKKTPFVDNPVHRPVFGFTDIKLLSDFKKRIIYPDDYNITFPEALKSLTKPNTELEAYTTLHELQFKTKDLLDTFDILDRDSVAQYNKLCSAIEFNLKKLNAPLDSEVIRERKYIYADIVDSGTPLKDAAQLYLKEVQTNLTQYIKAAEDAVNKYSSKFDIKTTSKTKSFVGTADELGQFIEDAVQETLDAWNSVSKIRGACTLYVFSKAGLGSEGLMQLWEQGIIDVPGWRNVMSMLLHHTDATAQVMLNPHTVYSYIFEDFYNKELIKEMYGSGVDKKFVPKRVLQELTKSSKRMSRIKRGITTSFIRHHYDNAYELLTLAKELLDIKVVTTKLDNGAVITKQYTKATPINLKLIDLTKLPKANTIAYLMANYDTLQEFFVYHNKIDALAKLELFKSFDSLRTNTPEFAAGPNAHAFVRQYKRQNVAKIDDKGNPVDIFTHRIGGYEDIADVINASETDAKTRLKEMQRFNDDHHLFTALDQATASLHRRASERVERVKQFFKNATAEERELYHKQIDDIDVIYSKEHLNHFLYRDNAPQLFKNEARLSGGRKAFFSEECIDLSDFEKAGIITRVKPVTLENGVSGYMHLLGVRMKDYQDIITLNHELTPDVLKSLGAHGIVVKSEKIINNGVTTYKYIFNNATELSKDIVDAKIIDDLDIDPKLKELHIETRTNDAAYVKNIGYSNGDVQTEQLFNAFDVFLGDEAKELIPVEDLKSLRFFNDLKANQVVIGARPIQAEFNPYACSDFIRRSAYSTVNYIDTQLDAVTHYLNMLCNNENGLRTSDWLKDLTDADLYEVLKNNKDFTLVYVRPSNKWSKTKSGLVVEKVNINGVKSITLAKQLNAHLVPTYSAYTMMQAVNTFELPPMLRLIQNISTLYKVGYLSSVGWLVRNFVDSNYKNHLDFKDDVSIHKQVQDLFNTMRLVMNYTNTLQGVGRTLDNVTEYKALYHLCKDSPETLTKLLNQNNSLARYIKRFQNSLSEDKIDEISKHLIDVDLFEVIDLFIKNGPSAGVARSLKNTVPTTNLTTQKFVDYWTTKGLTGMLFNANELIEQSARLQSYMYALQHGASLDEAVARVIKTHFDYSDKSLAMLYTELVFPFMSFSFKNLEYWIDTIYSKGIVAGELENVFRCVLDYNSLFNPDYEVYRNYDYSFDFEKDVIGFRSNQPWQLINAARLYHMLNGNIVWDTGKDVKYNNGHGVKDADLLAVFKLSPSILDAVNMLYTPLDQFQQRMLPPAEILVQSIEAALSGDTTSLSETISINGLLNNLPFVGATLQRLGINGDGSTKSNNVIKRIEDDGIRQALSSLFTAAYVPHKKYNTWYDENNQYLTKLPQYEYTKSPYYYSRLGVFKMNYVAAKHYGSYYNPNASRYRIESLARSPYRKSIYGPSKNSSLRTTYYSSLTYNTLEDSLIKKRVLDKYRYL